MDGFGWRERETSAESRRTRSISSSLARRLQNSEDEVARLARLNDKKDSAIRVLLVMKSVMLRKLGAQKAAGLFDAPPGLHFASDVPTVATLPEEPREENEITSPPEDEDSPESDSEKETAQEEVEPKSETSPAEDEHSPESGSAQEEAEPKSEESDDKNVQNESVPPLETPDQDSTEQTQEINSDLPDKPKTRINPTRITDNSEKGMGETTAVVGEEGASKSEENSRDLRTWSMRN